MGRLNFSNLYVGHTRNNVIRVVGSLLSTVAVPRGISENYTLLTYFHRKFDEESENRWWSSPMAPEMADF